MEKVRKPYFVVIYEGKNISEDIRASLSAITYTDKVSGSADEISLSIQDERGLWRNQWMPSKGDKIEVKIGYTDYTFPCGIFEVDELGFSGPPDTVSIRGIAAPISKSLRQKNSYAHENRTLKQIAEKIAEKHGFSVQGSFKNNIVIERSTQYEESDLAYLDRIAKDFGYIFSVRDSTLVFTSIYDLEGSDSVIEIHRSDMSRFDIEDKTSDSYKGAKVKYTNPIDQTLIEGTVEGLSSETAADYLEVRTKAESVQQAEEIAASILHNANTRQQIIRATIEGNVSILSGVNIDVSGFGRLSGKYQVTESTHSLNSSGGYTTSFDAKKIAEIELSKWL